MKKNIAYFFLLLILIFPTHVLLAAQKKSQSISRTYEDGPVAISKKLKTTSRIDPVVQRTHVPVLQPPVDLPHIVIDPGHGGEDYGTYSTTAPRYQEKLLTLASAMMLKRFLHQLGYKTTLTRKEDVFISLDQRALVANKLQPTLFVSLHYNSAPSAEAEGIEIYYYRTDENKKRASKSKELAQHVLERALDTTQAKSRGVKHGNFAVIRETEMPAILIEGGFLTHPEERARIKNPIYLKQLTWGIAMGIDDYIQSNGMK